MLKAFSPGAQTPPPESVSRWSYHVSCLFHSDTRTQPGKVPFTVPGGRSHDGVSSESIYHPPRDAVTLAKLLSCWDKTVPTCFPRILLRTLLEHVLNFSRLLYSSRSFVRSFIRPLFYRQVPSQSILNYYFEFYVSSMN